MLARELLVTHCRRHPITRDIDELSKEKGVAELKSSVVRINSINALSARPIGRGVKKEIKRSRRARETVDYIEPRMGTAHEPRALD